MRKLRLIALVTLCVRSETQELRYEDVVNALLVDISAVEEWVIDGKPSAFSRPTLSHSHPM